MQFRAERDKSCFVKLRLTNRHHRFLKVHIPKRQGKSFADTQAGTIKQQQQRAKSFWLELLLFIQTCCIRVSVPEVVTDLL